MDTIFMNSTAEKVSLFPALGLNTERYEVSVRIQSECGKMQEKCRPK